MSGHNRVVGSFSDSSKDIRLDDGHILRAQCKNEQGHWVNSDIDLNSCIGNLNGYLSWDYINFQHSAGDIKLAEGGSKLECVIRRQDGQNSAPQGIWLNERIRNKNGRLTFVPHTEAN